MKYLKIILFFSALKLVAQDPAIIPKSEDSLEIFLKTYPKDTVYVRALRPYALIQINKHANYAKADSVANVILNLSEKLKYGRGIYFHYLIKAIIANQKSDASTSVQFFIKSYETVIKYKLHVSLEEASLNNIAVGYEQLGNRDLALEYALKAIKVQEQPNYPIKWLDSGPYGMVSSIYKFKKQYKQAENYSKKAFEIAKKKEDKKGMAIQKNKLGNILDDQDLKNEALKEYMAGLKLAEEAEYPLLQTDLLDNIGRMLTDLKQYKEAEVYLKKNEALCQKLESPIALSSAFHSLGMLYKAQGNNDLAVKYFKRAFEKSKTLSDQMKVLNTATSLSETYAAMGEYKNAYQYLIEAKVANDSLFSEESDEKMQEMLTKYETEKKELAIKQLESEKKQANFRLIVMGVIGLLAAVSAFLFFNNYKSRQKIKELETTQKLRNRISADLHDEIGSTLSSISILSEMLAIQPKTGSNPEVMQQISNDARKVIEKMDEIIWTINPNNDEFLNLEARLKSYVVPLLESKGIDFSFDFSDNLENRNIEMEKRKDIYLILKEAINNAIKYSECKNLWVTGSIENGKIKICIKDNGKGFDFNEKNHRNGLGNMHKRAENIGGRLNIYSEINQGTTIHLEID